MDSIIDRRSNNTMYQLDPDADRGFTNAVRNSQVRLALEYALIVIHKQGDRITQLEDRLGSLEKTEDAPRRGRKPKDAEEPTPPPPVTTGVPVKEEPPPDLSPKKENPS